MSLKRMSLLIILILVVLAGGYILFFGVSGYVKYSGRERNFNNLKDGELLNDMLVKGDIETVTYYLGSQSIDNEVFGMSVSDSSAWYYYALPLEYHEDKEQQKYCVIAVSEAEDIKAVEALLKSFPVPRDPNAPRFEFRGIVMNMNIDVHALLSEYLWEIYDTYFNIYTHANVSRYISPYTIYVRNGKAGGIKPIIIGAAILIAGGVLLTLLCVNTYRKKHMY